MHPFNVLRMRTPAAAGATITSSDKVRVDILTVGGGATTTQILEMELRATVHGTNLCVGGTASVNNAGSGSTAAQAFDGNTSSGWTSAGVPAWIQYDFPAPVTPEELVILTGLNSALGPMSITISLWDGSAWQVFATFAGTAWAPVATKYWRKTANEIWLKDTMTGNNVDGTSYADGQAMMGVRVTATANCLMEGVEMFYRRNVGGRYQAVLYQLDGSDHFVAELAAGPISAAAGAQVAGNWTHYFTAPVTLVSGTRYAFGIRRVDGSGTSNVDGHFNSGTSNNQYRTAPLTVRDVWCVAINGTPPVGTASNGNNGTALVWRVVPIFRQSP